MTPRWLAVHLGAVALVVGFLLLGWWQINRFRGGNPLSFGYAIEWPAFAAFVVYVWIKEIRQVLRAPADQAAHRDRIRPVRGSQHTGPAYDDSGDDELAAYNRYLAWLNANPQASPSKYPG